MRAALRLAHDQLAPQELDRLAGAEDADLDQASVLRPSPAPRSGRIRCHVSRLRRAPRGVNVPNQRLHLRAILAGRQGVTSGTAPARQDRYRRERARLRRRRDRLPARERPHGRATPRQRARRRAQRDRHGRVLRGQRAAHRARGRRQAAGLPPLHQVRPRPRLGTSGLAAGRSDTLQTSISVADQEALELTLPLARAREMGVIAKRPLENVAWRHARKPTESYYQDYWSRLRALDYDFLKSGPDAAVATALRFTLGTPGVHTAIVGTTRPERWEQNAALLQAGPLPRDEVERIRARWREVADSSWEGQV